MGTTGTTTERPTTYDDDAVDDGIDGGVDAGADVDERADVRRMGVLIELGVRDRERERDK